MQDARVRAALLIVCLACLLGSAAVLFAGHHAPVPPPITITPPPTETVTANRQLEASRPAPKPSERVYVDVAGCVRRPSLYVLPAGSRVMQAILAAGGPTAEADMDAVNLAEKITDGEKVVVPKHIPDALAEEAASTPQLSAHALLAAKLGKDAKNNHSGKLTTGSVEQIPLNTATAEQLERLPSVGPSMAERILAYRQQAGSFSKVEDLMEITGIGPKKFAKIAPFVKLN